MHTLHSKARDWRYQRDPATVHPPPPPIVQQDCDAYHPAAAHKSVRDLDAHPVWQDDDGLLARLAFDRPLCPWRRPPQELATHAELLAVPGPHDRVVLLLGEEEDRRVVARRARVCRRRRQTCVLFAELSWHCLLYTSPSPRDGLLSRMPSSA